MNGVSKGGIRESDARAGGGSLREDLSTFLGPPTSSGERTGRIGEGCASGATSGGKRSQPKRRSQFTQRARARRVDKAWILGEISGSGCDVSTNPELPQLIADCQMSMDHITEHSVRGTRPGRQSRGEESTRADGDSRTSQPSGMIPFKSRLWRFAFSGRVRQAQLAPICLEAKP